MGIGILPLERAGGAEFTVCALPPALGCDGVGVHKCFLPHCPLNKVSDLEVTGGEWTHNPPCAACCQHTGSGVLGGVS